MNKNIITNIHEDIVTVLVERLKKNPSESVITYSELCQKIGNQVNCRNVASYLGDISCWCNEIGAPMLSALVINRKNNRPGKGFYKLYSELHETSLKNMDEELVFVYELKRIFNYHNWMDFKFYLGI